MERSRELMSRSALRHVERIFANAAKGQFAIRTIRFEPINAIARAVSMVFAEIDRKSVV